MNRTRKLIIGVLASGNGSNLQALIDACESGRLSATVGCVISDVPGAKALARAEQHGIPASPLDRQAFASRKAFEERIVAHLREHHVELVCLAGYMRIVGPTLLLAFPHRIMNIHPALLPAFPGLDAQQQALAYGVKIAGCTVHFVDEETDHGPIICQTAIAVHEDDTAEGLAARILAEEHRLYPEAVELFAQGRLDIQGRRVHIRTR